MKKIINIVGKELSNWQPELRHRKNHNIKYLLNTYR